jgi:hypothetical protein
VSGGPRRRAPSNVAKRRSVLVFTEGLKTEPMYFTHWHRLHRERVIVIVDEHPDIGRAIELATGKGISIAVSNPCIELWFLLHFHDQRAAIDRAEAQRKSGDLLGCGKVPTTKALEQLFSSHDQARCRAKALDKKHEMDGSPPRSNPRQRGVAPSREHPYAGPLTGSEQGIRRGEPGAFWKPRWTCPSGGKRFQWPCAGPHEGAEVAVDAANHVVVAEDDA